MSTFEFTFIPHDKKSIKTLEEVLTSFKGKKVKEDSLGMRTLAYPIKKVVSGEYLVWTLEIPEQSVKGFKQKLNFDNVVLRYLLLKKDEKQPVKKVTKKTK